MNPVHEEKITGLECWNSSIKIETLSGGMTNLNFKVSDADSAYVVRMGSDDPIHLISRANETATCHAAYAAGISPQLIHAEPGILVVRFVEGKVLQEADIRNDNNLARIASLMKTFHTQVPVHFRQVPVMFWVFQVLRHYQHLLQSAKSRYHAQLALLDKAAKQLEKAVGQVDIVFGHNDLLAANFIDAGEKLWLIDFDYAGFNSPLFDLSNLASNNELNPAQECFLLEIYFGSLPTSAQWRSYYAMKCASLLRETLWSMVSELHSDLEVDFVEYTAKNLDRFEQSFRVFENEYGST